MTANDFPGIEIHDNANIKPIILKFEAGDIADPNFIGCLSLEVLLQDVGWLLFCCNVYPLGIRADAG